MAQPPVFKFDAATNGDAAERQQLEEPDKSQDQLQPSPRPRRLPFLAEIRSRGPTSGTDSPGVRGQRGLPFIKEILAGHRHRTYSLSTPANPVDTTVSNEISTEYLGSPADGDEGGGRGEVSGSRADLRGEFIKSGQLWKTSRGRSEGSKSGPTRLRRFRLTEDALEYFQQFSHVKVKRSYPLTSIEDVKYNEDGEPNVFYVIFSTYEMMLQAENADEAKDWVKSINDAWSQWHFETVTEEDETGVEEGQETVTLELKTPSPTDVKPELGSGKQQPPKGMGRRDDPRKRSYSNPAMLRRESTEVEMQTYDSRRNRISNQARRLGRYARLRPKLEKAAPVVGHDTEISTTHKMLHIDRAMIKYPRRLLGIPHEKLFKLDKDNLQLLWRRNASSKFRQSSTLSLHKIVEVREGQNTEKFDKFPFEQVENQSFSLIFEQEYKKKYVHLSSLDIICDHPDNYDLWMKGLRALVTGPQWCSIYPTQYQDTDPTILWLKQLWSCKSNHRELPEKTAIKMVQKFIPTLTLQQARLHVIDAHLHQFRHTFSLGNSLRWDGFMLLFNLLCGTTNSRLYPIFRGYAKQYPKLGLNQEEFRNLLINECHWKPKDCKPSVLQELMRRHDFHHRAFKKFAAQNRPLEYQVADKLFSYAGFISFLRSKDNSAVDPEHETVYQDMTQPLSHYFINSSHNTYLEGDQLRGKSSTDAYVRAFLQGCRCVEIDCWDDTLNVTNLEAREPIIYHGFTLTTKLPFRDVIHTIKEYGFTSSIYPVIISIENHCNKSHQSRMAKIFRAIFEEMLPDIDLVEEERRARLPSPQELQGKIILKGAYKRDEGKTGTGKRAHRVRQRGTLTHSSSVATSIVSTTSLVSVTSTPSNSAPTSPLHSLSRQQSSEDHNNGSTHNVNEAIDGHVSPPAAQQPGSFSPIHRDRFSRGTSLREIRRKLVETEQGQDDQELTYEETVGDLKSLIIYAKSISIKPWDWTKQKATPVTQMFSFGEPTAIQLCSKWPRDMLACSERQLVRTYPKGTRFDSTNYDPLQMWRCGVQMVALNFQYPDIHMHLNQGFFRQNGGCGYVLKPDVMRKEDPGGSRGGSTPFNPEMQVQHPNVPAVNFEIELISGQRLCPWKKKCSSVTVEIHTYGIIHDCTKMEPANHTNLFWPQWIAGRHKIEKKILMPELCLVYFRVDVDGKKMYGQNCIPLVSLQPGIKFIPLRSTGGELIPESGVFVRINKVEVQEVQTNSLRSNRLRRQASVSGEDDDPKTLSIIAEREEDLLHTPDNIDVEESINPLVFSRHSKAKSASNPRPVSSPPLLEGTSTNDTIGSSSNTAQEVKETNQVKVVVELHSIPEAAESAVVKEASLSVSKPRSLTIEADSGSNGHVSEDSRHPVGVARVGTVKEYHLQIQSQPSQEEQR